MIHFIIEGGCRFCKRIRLNLVYEYSKILKLLKEFVIYATKSMECLQTE